MKMIIAPGINGSDADHWQSLWQAEDPTAIRIAPSSWDEPTRDDWVAALDAAVQAQGRGAVVIAHSLGCLTVAQWLANSPRTIAGAFLVAPPDPDLESFPLRAARDDWRPPAQPLGVPGIVLASSDDPHCSLARAHELASGWGADLVDVGPHGHINSASNLGAWDSGKRIFAAFRSRLEPRTTD